MKTFSFLKISFIIIGSVIGAGFITGRELIRFFGSTNFIPPVYIACMLLFFFSYLLMDIGRYYGSLANANALIFKKYSKCVSVVTFISLMIITSGMLAGIDTLLNTAFKIPSYFFVFSILSIIAANFIVKKGLDGIAKISLVLVPVMIIFVLSFLLLRKNFTYVYTENYSSLNSLIMAIFYASMNMFLAAPLLIETGNKYKKNLKKGALVSGICLFICIILILSAICFEGSNAITTEMPMFYITGYTGILASIFTVIVFFAMFTSLVSSYYPIHKTFEKGKNKTVKIIIVCAVAFLLSRLGLKGIVQYFYPVLGAFGMIYLSVCGIHMIKDKKLFPLDSKFFNKRNNKIHKSGKQTQNYCARHN